MSEPIDYDDLPAVGNKQEVMRQLADWVHKWPGGAPNEVWSLVEMIGNDCTIGATAVAALREELKQWETWGVIEVAIRNPNIDSAMRHWEGRAERAEADNAALRKDAERYRYLRNPPSELVAVEAYIGGGKWAFIEGEQVDVTVDAALLAGKKP